MSKMFSGNDLTFVICTYKECPYLEDAILSLKNQTVQANIMISTSTPNKYVENLAEKYSIEIRVNPEGGQVKDYNFAMQQPSTPLIMLMHQDEILVNTFVERSISSINSFKKPIISFTDYAEMHNDVVDSKATKMIRIKRMMLAPAKWKWIMTRRFGKRMIQMLGDPICHPTVICVKDEMPEEIFREDYRASMDWDLWERLSLQEGSFVYVPEVLLYHRMNDDNQTVKLLNTTNDRYENESEIFARFWPKPIVRVLMKFYTKAAKFY